MRSAKLLSMGTRGLSTNTPSPSRWFSARKQTSMSRRLSRWVNCANARHKNWSRQVNDWIWRSPRKDRSMSRSAGCAPAKDLRRQMLHELREHKSNPTWSWRTSLGDGKTTHNDPRAARHWPHRPCRNRHTRACCAGSWISVRSSSAGLGVRPSNTACPVARFGDRKPLDSTARLARTSQLRLQSRFALLPFPYRLAQPGIVPGQRPDGGLVPPRAPQRLAQLSRTAAATGAARSHEAARAAPEGLPGASSTPTPPGAAVRSPRAPRR